MFRSVDLLLPLPSRRMPRAAKTPHSHPHYVEDQRRSGPHKNAQSEGLFYLLSQRAPCNLKLDSPRGIRLNHIHLDAAKNFRSYKISNSDSRKEGKKFKALYYVFGVHQSLKALPSALDLMEKFICAPPNSREKCHRLGDRGISNSNSTHGTQNTRYHPLK